MKVNELMIGDWVRITLSNKIGKVYRIDEANGNGNGWAAVIDGDYHETRLEPIHLTPEILEKNGFIKEPREFHTLQYCIITDGLWIDISEENYFEGKLEFVHQLQHALRLCGITREIIL